MKAITAATNTQNVCRVRRWPRTLWVWRLMVSSSVVVVVVISVSPAAGRAVRLVRSHP